MVEALTGTGEDVNVLEIPAGTGSTKLPKAYFAQYKMLDGKCRKRLQRIADGSIVKRFELTPYPQNSSDVVCPHFVELKWGYGCPYDCAWCFLKGTLRLLPNKTAPTTKPREKIMKHLLSALHHVRIPEMFNTGELCDSLMDERSQVPFSWWVTRIFQSQSTHKVLFLTKSNYVDRMAELDSYSQVVVSFSLNAEKVSKRWEKAPCVRSRIKAAAKLSDAGWAVRIRIDPMVPITDWERKYSLLVDQIFGEFTPERVTLGTLRGLRSTLNNVRDSSWVKYLDQAMTGWGLKTLDKTREEMYRLMLRKLENHIHLDRVGLCKETVTMFDSLDLDFKKQVCNCMW